MKIHRSIQNLALFAAGFQFLRLRGDDLKYFQYIYPSFFCLVFLYLTYEPSESGKLFSMNTAETIAYLQEIAASVIGFFIAGLAAMIAFDGSSLDRPVLGQGVTRPDGKSISRRELLASLFGYCIVLCLLPLALPTVFGVATDRFAAFESFTDWAAVYLVPVIIVWCVCSLVSSALIGLYYLINHFER